nr:MAG TPA: hypothetical protein [Caudoviricetes sp.]
MLIFRQGNGWLRVTVKISITIYLLFFFFL